MPTVPLPQDPNLEQLRRQARDLQRAVRQGEPRGTALAAEFRPGLPMNASFPLSAAQLVIARCYGFASWSKLRRHLDVVTPRSFSPDSATSSDKSPADRFLRVACLTYQDDSPADREAAAALLAADPQLPSSSIAVAAACADAVQVRQFLATDPSSATAPSGPFGWSPLLYQAFARLDVGLDHTLDTARLLIGAGADPNDGRFWHGLPTPFTVLTGVFGAGEGDQPSHPHAMAFARLLLQSGADPNDGQTLYNRMFSSNDDHLVLLFEYGLGRGDGGPWHRLLGDALESPRVMLRNLLWWAITHDQRERVALLAGHGVDIQTRFTEVRYRTANGHTPIEEALLSGHRELADQLLALGAAPARVSPVDAFVAGALAGDIADVTRADPATVDAVRQARPGLVVWAAAQGAPTSVELLVAAGFDVNAYGRSDAPIDQPWHTALHVAAQDGNHRLAERLLALGADPQLRDVNYDATALDWARYFDHADVAALLASVTEQAARS